MEGKIDTYSKSDKKGVVVTSDNKKFQFSAAEWSDDNNSPEVGKSVEFEIDGNNIKNLKLKTDDKIDYDNMETIEVDLNYKESLNRFFKKELEFIDKNKDYLEYKKVLDYDRIKRFLLTAYNTLIEIEHNFEDNKIVVVKKELEEAYERKKFLQKETKSANIAYDNIFIRYQSSYKEVFEVVKRNNAEAELLNSKSKSLEILLKEKEAIVKKISKKDLRHKELTSEIKKLKRNMVDAIHKAATIKELNENLNRLIDEFYKSHFEGFNREFLEFKKEYLNKAKKIQDAMAYIFDTIIWDKANHSKTIRTFFQNSGIYDEFSSVTFLKYFLNTLDKNKMSKQQKELEELLHYFEKQRDKRVIYFDNDLDSLKLFKEIVSELDRNIFIFATYQAAEVLQHIKKDDPNFLIVNPAITNANIEQLIQYLRKKMPYCKIIFIVRQLTKDILLLAKRYRVNSIIEKSSSKEQTKSNFLKMLG